MQGRSGFTSKMPKPGKRTFKKQSTNFCLHKPVMDHGSILSLGPSIGSSAFILLFELRVNPSKKTLDWLLDQTSKTFPRTRIDLGENLNLVALRGLPFTRGCSGLFMTGATLFLASIFGRENDGEVLEVYRRL